MRNQKQSEAKSIYGAVLHCGILWNIWTLRSLCDEQDTGLVLQHPRDVRRISTSLPRGYLQGLLPPASVILGTARDRVVVAAREAEKGLQGAGDAPHRDFGFDWSELPVPLHLYRSSRIRHNGYLGLFPGCEYTCTTTQRSEALTCHPDIQDLQLPRLVFYTTILLHLHLRVGVLPALSKLAHPGVLAAQRRICYSWTI